MKRCLLTLCALTLVLLSACRPNEEKAPAPEEGPLQLETLSIEVPRTDLTAGDLAQAVRELPEALKTALAAQDVEVGTVTVSVGSSPAATAQAVSEGGVDLAFLPAADFAALEAPPRLILTTGEGDADENAMAAAVRPDGGALEGEAFASALAAAVEEVRAGELGAVFGPLPYAPAEDLD